MQTGIQFAMERPVIIAMTKIDLATPEQDRQTETGIYSVLKLVFEVAGMREEMLVNHSRHTEAMMMNVLIEMEIRLQKLETERQNDKS